MIKNRFCSAIQDVTLNELMLKRKRAFKEATGRRMIDVYSDAEILQMAKDDMMDNIYNSWFSKFL